MTVGRLEHEMSTREYLGWIAYHREKNAAEGAPAPRPRRPGQSGNLMDMTGEQALAAFGFAGGG